MPVDPSAHDRWVAWIERGDQHDKIMNRRVRIVLIFAAAALALAVGVLLEGGL